MYGIKVAESWWTRTQTSIEKWLHDKDATLLHTTVLSGLLFSLLLRLPTGFIFYLILYSTSDNASKCCNNHSRFCTAGPYINESLLWSWWSQLEGCCKPLHDTQWLCPNWSTCLFITSRGSLVNETCLEWVGVPDWWQWTAWLNQAHSPQKKRTIQ